MPNVTVAATWRMARVEMNAPYDPGGAVVGYGEVLLQQAAGPAAEEAAILRRTGMAAPKDNEPVTYGTMTSDMIVRSISAVASETVDIDGKPVSFMQVLDATRAFFERWRIEDHGKPPDSATMAEPPPAPPSMTAPPTPQDLLAPVIEPPKPPPRAA